MMASKNLDHLIDIYRNSEPDEMALFLRSGSNGGAWAKEHPACASWPALLREAGGHFHHPEMLEQLLQSSADKLIEECTLEGELLQRDLEALEQTRIISIPKVRHGLVVDEILDEVHSGDHDLVVIGSYPSDGWGRFLLDDLAQKIVTQMACPVLIVR